MTRNIVKVVEYAKTHGKNIRLLSQTPLNNLINVYRKIKNISGI